MVSNLSISKRQLSLAGFLLVASTLIYNSPSLFNLSGDLQAIIGIPAFLAIAWVFSESRKDIDVLSSAKSFLVLATLSLLFLKVPFVRTGVEYLASGILALKTATLEGTSFVFGYLGSETTPFLMNTYSGSGNTFIFAFQALPMIMVVSALAMVLFHFGIMTRIVKFVRIVFEKLLDMGGAMGTFSSAKIFLGQTDAPLLIKPYMKNLSRSELFTLMTAGMATTSCMIIALYAMLMQGAITDPMIHILTATVVNIPAAILISRIMIPSTGAPTKADVVEPYKFGSFMEAVSKGATDGLQMFLGIIAMIIVSLALVALIDMVLANIPLPNGAVLSLGTIFGFVMSPLTWLMGVPVNEAVEAGKILGLKTALNEVIAFVRFGNLEATGLSVASTIIMIYAICGFANLSSIGIQIAGLGSMVPDRKAEIIKLAPKALIAGTIAGCLSGTIVGLILKFL